MARRLHKQTTMHSEWYYGSCILHTYKCGMPYCCAHVRFFLLYQIECEVNDINKVMLATLYDTHNILVVVV